MIIKKKGVSPVIASVLMILLVIVLVGLVFSWARGFVSARGEDVEFSSSSLCESVDFSIVVVGNVSDSYSFEAVNRGNIDISALRFNVFSGGNSNITSSSTVVLAGGSNSGNVVLSSSGVIEEVEVLAVLDKELVGTSLDAVCVEDPVNLEGFHDYYIS